MHSATDQEPGAGCQLNCSSLSGPTSTSASDERRSNSTRKASISGVSVRWPGVAMTTRLYVWPSSQPGGAQFPVQRCLLTSGLLYRLDDMPRRDSVVIEQLFGRAAAWNLGNGKAKHGESA